LPAGGGGSARRQLVSVRKTGIGNMAAKLFVKVRYRFTSIDSAALKQPVPSEVVVNLISVHTE
jgi:hypothetical protein